MSDAKLEQLLQDASSGGFTALQELLRFLRKEKVGGGVGNMAMNVDVCK